MSAREPEEVISSAETGAPLVLVTGLPGAGKTLYALAKFAVGKRDVWQCNIPGCILPTFEPMKWPEFLETVPQDSTLIFDETREIFPPVNATQKLPDYYSFHRIRHTGRRVVLICQHPGDIDARVRRLVGRHLHLVEGFGGGHSVVYEFRGVGDTETRARAQSSKFTHPKDVFKLYKSAETHHKARKAPLRVRMVKWVLVGVVVAMIAGGVTMYRTMTRLAHGGAAPGVDTSKPSAGPSSSGGGKGKTLTSAEYVQTFVPRVQHLDYTASRYDDITKPVRAPVPAACIMSKSKGCTCYSQQATLLDVGDNLCEQIVAHGRFQDFDADGKDAQQNPPVLPGGGATPVRAQPAPAQVAMAAPEAAPVGMDGVAVVPQEVTRTVRAPTYMPPPVVPGKTIRR